jgi:hypothetical protein
VDVSRSVPQSRREIIEKKGTSEPFRKIVVLKGRGFTGLRKKSMSCFLGGLREKSVFCFSEGAQGFSPAKKPQNTRGFSPGPSFHSP